MAPDLVNWKIGFRIELSVKWKKCTESATSHTLNRYPSFENKNSMPEKSVSLEIRY